MINFTDCPSRNHKRSKVRVNVRGITFKVSSTAFVAYWFEDVGSDSAKGNME